VFFKKGKHIMAKTRLSLEMSEEMTNFLDKIATREDTTRVEVIRRSLSILKAYDRAWQQGRQHIGFADSAKKLDTELVGVFTVDPKVA
jgi:predicted transcriptional regulator